MRFSPSKLPYHSYAAFPLHRNCFFPQLWYKDCLRPWNICSFVPVTWLVRPSWALTSLSSSLVTYPCFAPVSPCWAFLFQHWHPPCLITLIFPPPGSQASFKNRIKVQVCSDLKSLSNILCELHTVRRLMIGGWQASPLYASCYLLFQQQHGSMFETPTVQTFNLHPLSGYTHHSVFLHSSHFPPLHK